MPTMYRRSLLRRAWRRYARAHNDVPISLVIALDFTVAVAAVALAYVAVDQFVRMLTLIHFFLTT